MRPFLSMWKLIWRIYLSGSPYHYISCPSHKFKTEFSQVISMVLTKRKVLFVKKSYCLKNYCVNFYQWWMFLAPHSLPNCSPRHTPANSFMHKVLIKFSSRQLRCKSRRIASQVQRELHDSTSHGTFSQNSRQLKIYQKQLLFSQLLGVNENLVCKASPLDAECKRRPAQFCIWLFYFLE